MGKKSRPQFVPEPLAVQVFRKTEKMDGPRLLPPLAAASENTPKVPAAHEVGTVAWDPPFSYIPTLHPRMTT